MVVADQRDRLDDLRLVEMRREHAPCPVTERVSVDQVVDQRQQGLLLGLPARGIRRVVHGGGDLGVAEADLAGEQGDMDAPFVLAAETRRGAVDDDLALAQAERSFVEQAAGEHLAEHARALRHGAEQHQRLEARRHDAFERFGDGGWVGRFGGSNAGHATDTVVNSSPALQ